MGMRLQNGRPGSHDLPSFAPGVAGSTHLTQSALCSGTITGVRQRELTGSFSRAIHIEDQIVCPLPIPASTGFLLVFQRTSQEIFEKVCTQRLDSGLVKRREKAGECRAMRQAFPSEEGHERVDERLHTLMERFQGAFATDRIPQQQRHKVDKIIVSKASACKAHLLL